MNKSIILHLIGCILNIEAALMVLPCIVALIYHEKSGFAFLITIGLCLLFGIPLTLFKQKSKVFFSREGYISVALGWIVLSLFGALPFFISREIPAYIDCLFEIVSGFTTTGSSILSDVEVLSHCILFWRSFSHWVGGMGILVFILAIVPTTGGETIHIIRAESPGPTVGKVVPKMRASSKLLYGIYIGMTLFMIALLLLGGMPLFDTLNISFGAAGTGGFSIRNSGCADYTAYQQIIITIFMFLFGVNFNVYVLIFFRKLKIALKSEELKWYFITFSSSVVLIAFNLGGLKEFFPSLRQAAFQVSSIMTTTGYATVDFNHWPTFSKTILVTIMFIGACAGSTGGGMKISRIVILFKSILWETSSILHKRSIKTIRFEGKKVEDEVIRSISAFFYAYFFIFAVSLLLISLDNFDFTTNFTAIASTLNNIGPGLGKVGPYGNFGEFSILSKLVMIFDMLAGRLEIFPILLLFTPRCWEK